MIEIEAFTSMSNYKQVDGLLTGEAMGNGRHTIVISKKDVESIRPFHDGKQILTNGFVIKMVSGDEYITDDIGRDKIL